MKMGETLDIKLTPNHLIALGLLGIAREPVHYMTFIKFNRDVLRAVVELKDKGIVREMEKGIIHPLEQEENTYYELTNYGKEYLNKIMKT